MLFNKEKYINAINSKDTAILIKSLLIVIIFIILGFIVNSFLKADTLIVILISLIIGIAIACISYSSSQVKIEEMKMKLDIYEKIMSLKDQK